MSSLLQKPDPCLAATVPMEESEELLLAGHHDLPAELLEQSTAPNGTGHDDDFYIKIEFKKVRLIQSWSEEVQITRGFFCVWKRLLLE